MAVDMFLKLDGIDGESQKDKAQGWIELESFSWGTTNESLARHGSGMATGKADFAPIHIRKIVDKSSPKLFLACCQGTHIKTGTLQIRQTTGANTTEVYLQIDLDTATVDSYTLGQDGNGGKASEQVSLGYSKINYKYWPQGKDGKPGSVIPAGWDVTTNKKL